MKLDQFLKWRNLVSSGGEAKIFINSGSVKVNGEIETRRGRKSSKYDLASAQVMCIFQLPAITDFLKILSPRKSY